MTPHPHFPARQVLPDIFVAPQLDPAAMADAARAGCGTRTAQGGIIRREVIAAVSSREGIVRAGGKPVNLTARADRRPYTECYECVQFCRF